MKSTNRIQRNGATKPAVSQLKTTATAAASESLSALTEMENAKNQSCTLLRLLSISADYQLQNGELTGEPAQIMSGGIAELVRITEDRLERAFDNVWEKCHPNRKAVAA